MKELYETPTVEFIEFDSEETIIMASGNITFGDNDFDINDSGWAN